jgi:DnaD/phage-associated family protein
MRGLGGNLYTETPDNHTETPENGTETLQKEKEREIKVKENKEKTTTPIPPPPGDGLLLSSVGQGIAEEVLVKNPFQLWTDEGFGKLTVFEAEFLKDAIEHYTEEWVADALKEAVVQGHKKWVYVEAILKNWAENGRDVGPPVKAGAGHVKENNPEKFARGKFGYMTIKTAADVDAALKERGKTIKHRPMEETLAEYEAERAARNKGGINGT